MTRETKIGMPPMRPPMTRERLLRLAAAGSRVGREHNAPHIAAICDALQVALREIDELRNELVEARGFVDEMTVRRDTPTVLVDLATSTAKMRMRR